jgi:hypothetical protein
MREAFKQTLIKSIWKHSVCQWDFRNEESHKYETRSMAEYKQHALDEKIKATYQDKENLTHPLTPLQEQKFQILIEDLLLMSYNIIKSWLSSSDLYILRSQAHNALSRGTEGSFLLLHTAGRPPDSPTLLQIQFFSFIFPQTLRERNLLQPP